MLRDVFERDVFEGPREPMFVFLIVSAILLFNNCRCSDKFGLSLVSLYIAALWKFIIVIQKEQQVIAKKIMERHCRFLLTPPPPPPLLLDIGEPPLNVDPLPGNNTCPDDRGVEDAISYNLMF